MYEEHEDGSFTLHLCEWYEQGRRLVGEYETLADGSGFAVTDKPNATGSTASCDPWERWATGNPYSADSRATGRRLRMAMMACLIHERTKGSSMMTGYAGHPA